MFQNLQFRDFVSFSLKVIVAHTVTYFIFGLIMSNLFNYAELFEQEIVRDFMRSIDSEYVLLGPLLQPVRGLVFAIGIWPLKNLIIRSNYGWLILWNVIVVFGILSTPAAAPCSIEGMLYSKLPLNFHLIGLPEILLQTLTFSLFIVWWIKPKSKSENRLLNSRKKIIISQILLAVMTASFAYIGYAIGGIIIAKISGVEVNFKEASASINLKNQLMFVFAFAFNIVSVLWLSQVWISKKIKLSSLFFVFWLIDVLVPLLYQSIFSYPISIHLALILGFFPALIIVGTLKLNQNQLLKF